MIQSQTTTDSTTNFDNDNLELQSQNSEANKANLIKNLETTEDESDENTQKLRPNKLDQVIGQENVLKQLNLIIQSAKIRSKLPEHILFYGQPGLGKTTLSNLIANELGINFKVITAPSLQKIGDLVSTLVGLDDDTLLFIDEIHRLKAPLEETLYSAMEDGEVDLVMGKGNAVNSMRMPLNRFVLIGATTQLGKISKPLKDRFPSVIQLESYNTSDMFLIVDRSCKILGIKIDEEAQSILAGRGRGVPRIINNILKRLLDYQIVHNIAMIDKGYLMDFLESMGILEEGLTASDLKYLNSIKAQPLGIRTIAGVMLEEVETIEQVIEPFLLHLGLIQKNNEGRSLTLKGLAKLEKLGKKV
jgi:holliday junction DNA helicase RuvB